MLSGEQRGRMKKHTTLFILFCILCSFNLYAENKNCLEIFSGYNNAALTDYNKEMQENELYFKGYDLKAQFTKLNAGPFVEINYVMKMDSKNAGEWGVYFKNYWLGLPDKQTIAYWSPGQALYTVDSDFSVFYSGLGLRKYFMAMYLGADAGAYYYFNNHIKEELYNQDGTEAYEVTRDWKPFFFGVNIECGVDLWILKSFAISLKGGYRVAKGSTEVNYNETGYETVTENGNLDYSGPYFGAGIVFDFSLGEKNNKPNPDEKEGW